MSRTHARVCAHDAIICKDSTFFEKIINENGFFVYQ